MLHNNAYIYVWLVPYWQDYLFILLLFVSNLLYCYLSHLAVCYCDHYAHLSSFIFCRIFIWRKIKWTGLAAVHRKMLVFGNLKAKIVYFQNLALDRRIILKQILSKILSRDWRTTTRLVRISMGMAFAVVNTVMKLGGSIYSMKLFD